MQIIQSSKRKRQTKQKCNLWKSNREWSTNREPPISSKQPTIQNSLQLQLLYFSRMFLVLSFIFYAVGWLWCRRLWSLICSFFFFIFLFALREPNIVCFHVARILMKTERNFWLTRQFFISFFGCAFV